MSIATAQSADSADIPAPKIAAVPTATGMSLAVDDESLAITVCSESVFHVVATPHGSRATHPQPWLLPTKEWCAGAPFQIAHSAADISLSTSRIRVSVDLRRGRLRYTTANGEILLSEYSLLPRTYDPKRLHEESSYHVVQRFSMNRTEAIYGLGQHQNGMFNYRGGTVELAQNNNDIAIPFLTSSLGYGILWNTASMTYVDNRFSIELSFDTLAADGIDYFFVYGPEMDDLVHQYRSITGQVPMLPRWAYGFIQSKDRYNSTEEILNIATRYRAEHIPLDGMVQDWYWWKRQGDPEFNEHYGNVPGDLSKLHSEHIHTMISTWPLLASSSDAYKTMSQAHETIGDTHVYDASNPAARDEYWKHLSGKLLAQGWDSFWLDSAEPEESYPHVGDAILRDKSLHIGDGAMYTNVFPLLHSEGVQDHWLATDSSKRPFLLVRSAFLGEQRVGSTVWSGDTLGGFWGLQRQIPAGLNYALSGLPYWTTDIGGYWRLDEHQSLFDAAYQELYMRWFEFGVFCPIFRTHGHRPENEMWSYPQIESDLITYDTLRYRLMPYIYSLAYAAHANDSTIQRPLVMDFRSDPNTWNIGDQFMFGPALLVSPVTEAGAKERRLYLPDGTDWIDFWTGSKTTGGHHLEASAPLNRIPLYVRAGSILPLGPKEEYADQHPDGPIELRIYPGADGHFTLYSDEGDNENYKTGQFATIAVAWNDAQHKLTIGKRYGAYQGMPSQMTFRIVIVDHAHGVGPRQETSPNRVVQYSGEEITTTFTR